MKARCLLVLVVMFVVAGSGLNATVWAAPSLINYQGLLTDPTGGRITGNYTMRFVLYDLTGSPVWSEERSVAVSDGIYNVRLGSVSPLTPDRFEADEAYLGVEIYNPETESWESLTPRQRITSTAYALQAENARALEGYGSGDFAPVVHAHAGGDITTGIVAEARIDAPIARDSEVTAAVDAHASRADNPHSTTAAQVGAVAVNQAGSITSGMIVDGQVGASDINTGQVQVRVSGSCTSGSSIRVINADGTVSCEADDVGSFSGWGLTGNAGTSPATNFIGTTDNQALAFRVNNQVALSIIPNGYSPNLIGGYPTNAVTAGVYGATIGGGGVNGGNNHVTDHFGTIGGGQDNQAGDNAGNLNDSYFATVGGGYFNFASGSFATVGGGWGNTSGYSATVGGGYGNTASGHNATVGGGDSNTASYFFATVGGGSSNSASGTNATVGGGSSNTASSDYATVGGGSSNTASSDYAYATVGGGYINTASGMSATVGGGQDNTATGFFSTVPGGLSNYAYGIYSFAAGRRAKAHNPGCFVWADSTDADLNCTNTNRFVTRASGGYHLFTNSDMSTYAWLAPGASTWSGSSDRNVKENYLPTDGRQVLYSLAAIPITTWNYKSQDPSIRHMGPVAQDFSAAFELGESDRHINTIDLDGVALAAIQGLYQMVKEKEKEIAEIARENRMLRETVRSINERLSLIMPSAANLAEK